MNKIEAIKYTMAHRKCLNKIAKSKGYYFPFHDLDKIFLYIFFGKKITGKLHRLYSKHHERMINGKLDIRNKIEAIFDWESCRFTKKDKPMTAYEYWLSACPQIDLFDYFCKLGFLPEGKTIEQCRNEIEEARNGCLKIICA